CGSASSLRSVNDLFFRDKAMFVAVHHANPRPLRYRVNGNLEIARINPIKNERPNADHRPPRSPILSVALATRIAGLGAEAPSEPNLCGTTEISDLRAVVQRSPEKIARARRRLFIPPNVRSPTERPYLKEFPLGGD